MSVFPDPDGPAASGHRLGVVCAPHHAAAEAGRATLAEGGNALEAMVAMAATIAAVYPHMNHVGGDGFWLVREPNKRVRAIMAPGPAGFRATRQLYREHEAIPSRGDKMDPARTLVHQQCAAEKRGSPAL